MNAVTEKESLDQKNRGLYGKFEVRRTDGSSDPGGRHEHDEFFVLNHTTDKHALPALRAYAASCRQDYPKLCEDLMAILRAKQANEFVTVPDTTLPNGQIVASFKVGRYMGYVGDDGAAEIRPDVVPTVDIDYDESKAACTKAGFKLLTETQALAIAVNIAGVAANWTGGKVGEGDLKQGLRKGNVDEAQRNDYVPEDEEESRIFLLSNGEVIYDAAGHIFTWVHDDVQGDENGIVAHAFAADSPSITSAPYPSEERGVGFYPAPGRDWSGDALIRSGYWYSGDNAGVFSLDYWYPDDRFDGVGFRCTLP